MIFLSFLMCSCPRQAGLLNLGDIRDIISAKGGVKMPKKQYYMPGVDKLNQLVETPVSRMKTESRRFIVNTAITIVAAIAAIVAAIVAIMTYARI